MKIPSSYEYGPIKGSAMLGSTAKLRSKTEDCAYQLGAEMMNRAKPTIKTSATTM
jgi:hypothetical protein